MVLVTLIRQILKPSVVLEKKQINLVLSQPKSTHWAGVRDAGQDFHEPCWLVSA